MSGRVAQAMYERTHQLLKLLKRLEVLLAESRFGHERRVAFVGVAHAEALGDCLNVGLLVNLDHS